MITDKYRWLSKEAGLSEQYLQDAVNQCDTVYEAYLGARHSDVPWVPAEVDRFMEAWLDGNQTGVDILEAFRVLYIQGHTGQVIPPDIEPMPGPEPAPLPSGEIVDFVQVPGTLGDKTYFGVGLMNGEIHYGEYGRQDNYRCALYKLPRVKVGEFDAESIFNIVDGIITIEQGGPDRKAQIWYNGQCVYEHPKWNIMLNCHKHTDGRYYVSGQYYGDPSDPAGVLVSSNKVDWEVYFENPYEYRFYDMCSRGSELWIASTSSGTDWGENDCNPAVFWNGNLLWRDTDHVNCGFWGIALFNSDIYLGRTGQAGVVRLSDHKTVLDLSRHESRDEADCGRGDQHPDCHGVSLQRRGAGLGNQGRG